MFQDSKRQYLFKCESCEMILSVDFEDEEDFLKIQEDKLDLECPCGSVCRVLRD